MPDTTIHTDDVAFSRNGLDSPLGKLCDPFKTDLDLDTGAMVRKLAADLGTSPSALLRDLACHAVRGKTYSDICHEAAKAKRDKLFGIGQFGSLKSPSAAAKLPEINT